MGTNEAIESNEQVDVDVEVCNSCGGLMSEEDGIEYCPTCDTQVDFFGDTAEEF